MGYRHVADFLADQSSLEIAAWTEYLRIEDQVQSDWVARAIVKAFGDGKSGKGTAEEDEPIIDTTKPEFTQQFKGFINAPGQPQQRLPQRAIPTEIRRC